MASEISSRFLEQGCKRLPTQWGCQIDLSAEITPLLDKKNLFFVWECAEN
jgi:hypothetical protein